MDAKSVLLDLFDAVNRGDLEAVARISGHDRVTESFRRLITAFDARIEIEWTMVDGDRAAAWAAIRGTHRGEWRGLAPTGRPIDVRGMLVVQVNEEGTVNDFWVANDWLSMATQIGVPLALPG